jgi:uncharacterized membrane protein HdeD (DUF308 family)
MRKIIGLLTPALIILAGALVVKYREDMVTWLTVGLGAIFFISGVISCISYYIQRKHVLKMRAEGITLFDSEGKPIGQSMPTFPIVGVGSMILGVILASMPETFLSWLTYIFAAIILLVSVYQITDLIVANRYGRVGWAYWVMPIIMLLAAIVALVNPEAISSSPLFFLGWAMMISGAVMIVNILKIYTVRRAAEKRAADMAKTAESAVEVNEETSLVTKE